MPPSAWTVRMCRGLRRKSGSRSRSGRTALQRLAAPPTAGSTCGPKDDYQASPAAEQSIAWTNWPIYTIGLVMRGHSDETIRKVLGENVLRVLKANTL